MTVRDPRAIAFLCNPSNVDLVGALLEGEYSVGEMGAKLQVPIKNLATRVYRMLQLGLARQTSEQARGGRPIKRYRTVAERFVLLMPDQGTADLVQLQKARLYPFLDRLVAAQVDHMRAMARGRLVVEIALEPAATMTSAQWGVLQPDGSVRALADRPFQHAWGHFQLEPDDIEAFMTDMREVMDRYMKRNSDQGEFVMCVGSVVPVQRPRGR